MLGRRRTVFSRTLAAVMAVLLLAAPAMAEDGRKFLSIDYREFPSFGAAVKNSLSPTDFRANTGAVLRNTLDPLNPGRYLASVVLVDVQRQLASGEGLDLGKIVSNLSAPGLALGYFGGQAGELMGAGLQSILANTVGPLGGIAGFALRPVLWYLGSSVGQDMGKGLAKGEVAPSKSMANALREFNPVQDASQMIGDAFGSVIGQALIPIPLVGAMVGGAIGGTMGLLAGKAFVGSGPGKSMDESLRRRLNNLADTFHKGPGRGHGAPPLAPSSGPAAPESTPVLTPPLAVNVTAPGPEASAAVRAAYGRLVAAMRTGDRARIEKAYGEMRQAGGK